LDLVYVRYPMFMHLNGQYVVYR